jgi:hypothetical protein
MCKEFKTRFFSPELRNRRKNENSAACSVKTATARCRFRITFHIFRKSHDKMLRANSFAVPWLNNDIKFVIGGLTKNLFNLLEVNLDMQISAHTLCKM